MEPRYMFCGTLVEEHCPRMRHAYFRGHSPLICAAATVSDSIRFFDALSCDRQFTQNHEAGYDATLCRSLPRCNPSWPCNLWSLKHNFSTRMRLRLWREVSSANNLHFKSDGGARSSTCKRLFSHHLCCSLPQRHFHFRTLQLYHVMRRHLPSNLGQSAFNSMKQDVTVAEQQCFCHAVFTKYWIDTCALLCNESS